VLPMRLTPPKRSLSTSCRQYPNAVKHRSVLEVEQLESRCYLSATAITFQSVTLSRHTLRVVDSNNLISTTLENELRRCGKYAINLVASYVNWKGCIDAEIRVRPAAENPYSSVNGLLPSILQQSWNGYAWKNDTLAEMISGVDAQPAAADVGCTIYLGQDGTIRNYGLPVWFDPVPSPYEVPVVPQGFFDFVGVFTHEVFHGLGFQGSSREFAGRTVTIDGYDYFNGAFTQAEVGGLLPLAPRSGNVPNDHYGNTDLSTNPIQTGLLFQWGNYDRNRLDIGRVDLAVLRDLGVSIRSTVGLPKVDVLDYEKTTTLASAPTLTAINVSSSQVVLNWTIPVQSGSSPITGFQLLCSLDGGVTWAKSGVVQGQSAVARRTASSRAPLFRVAPITDLGYGFFSRATRAVAPTVPSAPTNVFGISGNASTQITWAAPTLAGGVPIADYAIQYSTNGGKTWTTFRDSVSTNRVTTVSRLINGKPYIFRVAAKNAVGIGAFSAPSSVVVPHV
jgi:hypothetical protein